MLRPLPGVLVGTYLRAALLSQNVATQFHVAATGVTRYGLSHSGIKSVWLPIPPIEEQHAIGEQLDELCQTLKDTTARAEREIALIGEYRTRLIADVVTGKLDVREAAARLPDEIEEVDAKTEELIDGDDAELDAEPEGVEA